MGKETAWSEGQPERWCQAEILGPEMAPMGNEVLE